MEAQIRDEFSDVEVSLIESGGGRFEVSVDGRPIYSKEATGRHPSWEEVRDRLREGA